MKCRLLVALLCGIGCTSATAQVTSRFYLEKTAFAEGEPVFLYLDLVNKGSGPAEIDIGDPDQPLCSGVVIAVSGDALPGSTCPLPRDIMCTMNGQVDMKELQSGHTDTLRFLLNFRHEINAPGDYRVSAKFVGFAVYHVPAAVEKTEAGLEFRVETNPVDPGEWKPWVEQLRSPDPEKRQEAAKNSCQPRAALSRKYTAWIFGRP